MRILIVGSNQHWAIERIYLKYLREFNPDTFLFASQNLLHNYLNSSLLNKIYYRIGLSRIYKNINSQLIQYVEEIKPDVIWVFKGMEVLPETLNMFKKKGIKLVNYNPDHPFIISGRGSWNKNVFNAVGLYDLHFCYSKSLMKKIKDEYKIRTEFLPFGFELDPEIFEKVKNVPEIIKVCFIGNPDKIRANIIKNLVNKGIEVDVYGHNWNRYFKIDENEKLKIFDAVYADKFWEVARKYRVQLNIFRPHNFGSHNMRSFEVPGIGGILLAPNTDDHKSYFVPDSEIFLYNDIKSCIQKINYLMNLSKSDVEIIRDKARNRSINSGYMYKNQALKVLGYFDELLLNNNKKVE